MEENNTESSIGDTSDMDKCRETCMAAIDQMVDARMEKCPIDAYEAAVTFLSVIVADVATNFFPAVNQDEFRFFMTKILKRFNTAMQCKCAIDGLGVNLDENAMQELLTRLKEIVEEKIKEEKQENGKEESKREADTP